MAFLASLGPGRSGTALRLAVAGTLLFAVLVVLFNVDYLWRDPLLKFGFTTNALLFHVGLGYGLAARFGEEAKRGPYPVWAILANLVPVVLFWLMVYGIVQAIRTFT
jgi:hypothetical protein